MEKSNCWTLAKVKNSSRAPVRNLTMKGNNLTKVVRHRKIGTELNEPISCSWDVNPSLLLIWNFPETWLYISQRIEWESLVCLWWDIGLPWWNKWWLIEKKLNNTMHEVRQIKFMNKTHQSFQEKSYL